MLRSAQIYFCDAAECSAFCAHDGDTSEWAINVNLEALGIALRPDLCPRHVELIRSLLSNALPLGHRDTTADPRATEWLRLSQQMGALLSNPQPGHATWWQLFSARWDAIRAFLDLANNELSEE